MQQRWAEFQGRIEDDRLVTGQGRYVADVTLPGMAFAVLVRAPVAHAELIGIDTAEALAVDGVISIFTAKDLAADGIGDFPCPVKLPGADGKPAFPARRPVLVKDRIRVVGEPLAFVVAESQEAAEAAAELVQLNTRDLDAVTTTVAASRPDAPLIWPEASQNVAFVWKKGDAAATASTHDGAHHVARLNSQISRVHALTLEPRGAVGSLDADGRFVLHATNQSPHLLRDALARQLNVAADRVRVISGDVGGSFGMKSGAYPEDVLVLFAARRLGRPVKWVAERRESFLADDHGRDMDIEATLALDANGRFLSLEAHYRINIGAYLSGRSMWMLNNIGGIAGVYRIPQIAATVTGVYSNTMTNAPYRGAGRPEATYTIERLIDLAARDLGIDPFELRLRNAVPPSAMPYDTGFTFTYDCGEFEEVMLEAARQADRAGFAARREASKAEGRFRGLGIANPIEVAGGPFTAPVKDMTRIEVLESGRVRVTAGAMSTGQGLETMMVDLVSRQLGVPRETVDYEFGDTDSLPFGRGNGGSSAAPVGASATLVATQAVVQAGQVIAADMLECDTGEVTFADGQYARTGTNRSVTLAEVAKLARLRDPKGLTGDGTFVPTAVTFPNGCHMCEVEIDPETGLVTVVNYTIVEDIGTVLNPKLAHGQIQGGVAMGIGQALGEAVRYDEESGQLVTGSLMDYQLPRAHELPRVELTTRPVLTKANPLGVKGVGEAGTVGSMVAVMNAIVDALSPLGIRHIEMPATPARVWGAIDAARRGGGRG